MDTFRYRTIVLDSYVKGAEFVTRLRFGPDGCLYGAMTNRNRPGHVLFRYGPSADAVTDCGRILEDTETSPLQKDRYDIKLGHHALEFGYDGKLYGATSSTYLTWDADYKYEEVVGGHMVSYDPATGAAEDLGVLVSHNFTMAGAIDPTRTKFVGMVVPLNYLYVYDIRRRRVEVKAQLRGPWDVLMWGGYQTHDIVCDGDGVVWGSYGKGRLFRYDVAREALTETQIRIPGDVGVIDSIVRGNDGMLYAGTWDAHFFRIDPRTGAVKTYGKPVPDLRRNGALAVAPDGRVFGVVGGYSNMPSLYYMNNMPSSNYNPAIGNAHLFVFDPATERLEDLGFIRDEDPATFGGGLKICATVHDMAIAPDGTLYIGETDRYPHLYVGAPVA